MRYYLVDENGDNTVLNLDETKVANGIFSMQWNYESNSSSVYLKNIAGKYYRSHDGLNWEKVLKVSNLKLLNLGPKTYKIFRGYRPSGMKELKPGELVTQMPGKVVKLMVKVGDSVNAEDTLLILEAMKMENEIKAGINGVVKEVHVNEGMALDSGHLMIEIEAN